MKTQSTRKKFFSILTFIVFAQLASLQSFAADVPAKTVIHSVKVTYSYLLYPVDDHGMTIYQAILGGHVDFEGTPEVNVTVKIGGQVYTSPTDPKGNFSFFVYTNSSGRFEVGAWTPHSDAYVSSGSHELKRLK
jgi:hypothetical protein